ncbi:MAG TPA: YXWGXW repeat-containing protein [Gemmatales bacterium]|nr:YXWGXW repeat-containing protein [Gemmatales bacterium]
MSSLKIIHRLFQWSIVPLGAALISVATIQPASQAQPPSGDTNAGVTAAEQPAGTTVLTRGPIHEAFGQPTIFNPKPGLQIPKKPPAPVEELPPDEKPEGDNVSWIGGYWSWDEEKSDFMWISGFWRVLPPSRQWMPGYWNETGGQFQWVSGYWASAQQKQQEFIQEAPKDSLEQGAPPITTAPSPDSIWAPGTWVYRDSRYLWRPGYWVVNQPGWAWVPATYIWTPSGYIFVEGYWDWSIRRRGIIFAPCYFDYAVCYRPGFYYRPAVCLDIELITPHFFCRPAYGHYYFGDYYATSYLSIGITPWFNFTYARGSRFYSCDFAYYECHYRRTNPNWSVEIRLGYDRCRDNVAYRPARTYVAQQTIINNTTIVNNKTVINNNTTINNNAVAMAKPMKTYTATMAKSADAPMKFEKINDAKARDFGKTATEIRKVGVERVAMEKSVTTGSTAGTNTTVRTMNMPSSPIVSKMATTSTGTGVDAKNVNVGSISGGASKTPPPLPGNSGIKTLSGATGTGTTGTGSTSGQSKMDTSKTGTGSTGATGTGSTGTSGSSGSTGSRIPPVKIDPPAKGSGSTSGTGSKGSGSSSGNSKSGSSSSGNKDKEKGKP